MCRPNTATTPIHDRPTLVKTVPELTEDEWNTLDVEFNNIQAPLHHLMGMNEIPSDVAMQPYTELLHNFLVSKPQFQRESPTHFTRTPPTTLPEARNLKNILRKKAKHKNATSEDRKNFQSALRTLNFLIKKDKENKKKKVESDHESSYRMDFWKFSKEATKGTLGEEEVAPTFSKEEADVFYQGRYSNPVNIDTSKLLWFKKSRSS